jgi:hypothetical protein
MLLSCATKKPQAVGLRQSRRQSKPQASACGRVTQIERSSLTANRRNTTRNGITECIVAKTGKHCAFSFLKDDGSIARSRIDCQGVY